MYQHQNRISSLHIKNMYKLYPSSPVFNVNAPEGIFVGILEQVKESFLDLSVTIAMVGLLWSCIRNCFKLHMLPLILTAEDWCYSKKEGHEWQIRLQTHIKPHYLNCCNDADTTLKAFWNVQLLTSTTINRSGILTIRSFMFTLLSQVQNSISSDKNLTPTTLETAITTSSVLLSFQRAQGPQVQTEWYTAKKNVAAITKQHLNRRDNILFSVPSSSCSLPGDLLAQL